ncbi:hypothetical protein [Stenotrophomonas sp. SORGH_AS_0321]|uniref:hypothetical protein n=1 Tax=Stenotrophomonas sp. SORGH_AS_0321 TaxID=3041787 RepID=UPI00286AE047|nr:hypothetical protein [Stenotrophomonas sp. SORGH_AS_0321]
MGSIPTARSTIKQGGVTSADVQGGYGDVCSIAESQEAAALQALALIQQHGFSNRPCSHASPHRISDCPI